MSQVTKSAISRIMATTAASYFAACFYASEAFAQFSMPSAPSGNQDPLKKGADTFLEWANSAAGLVTAGATLAGVAVIAAAMANKMNWGWAGRIVGGLFALTGLSWIIQSIVT